MCPTELIARVSPSNIQEEKVVSQLLLQRFAFQLSRLSAQRKQIYLDDEGLDVVDLVLLEVLVQDPPKHEIPVPLVPRLHDMIQHLLRCAVLLNIFGKVLGDQQVLTGKTIGC